MPVCRGRMGSVQATHRYIKKALLHSDCPSVYRLSVFHVCGTLSTQRKRTGTVTICSTLLSYKVTKCRQNAEKGDYWISANVYCLGQKVFSLCISAESCLSVGVNFLWKVTSPLFYKDEKGWKAVSVFGDTANAINGVSFSVWVCYPNNKGMLWEQWGLIAQPFMRGPHKGPNHSSSLSLLSPSGKVSMP